MTAVAGMLARGETLYDLSTAVAAWKLQHRSRRPA
jgi:hypothetical protein